MHKNIKNHFCVGLKIEDINLDSQSTVCYRIYNKYVCFITTAQLFFSSPLLIRWVSLSWERGSPIPHEWVDCSRSPRQKDGNPTTSLFWSIAGRGLWLLFQSAGSKPKVDLGPLHRVFRRGWGRWSSAYIIFKKPIKIFLLNFEISVYRTFGDEQSHRQKLRTQFQMFDKVESKLEDTDLRRSMCKFVDLNWLTVRVVDERL